MSTVMGIVKSINDARNRAIIAGAIGGLFGWCLAQLTCGTPESFFGTLVYGMFAGLGLGMVLGTAEGLVIRSRTQIQRGALIGLTIGAAGGIIGAIFGQLGYDVAGAGGSSVFSSELQARLKDGGAQEGMIEIGLIWQNTNDLDLHVVEPTGAEIFFKNRAVASGGELDIDRNADCQRDVTNQPVEHVVWPSGTSPPVGVYKVFVNHFRNCGVSDPTPFRVETKVGRTVKTMEGSISYSNPRLLVAEFTWSNSTSVLWPLLARILGWSIFGGLVGCAEGIRRRSYTATRNAAIGGAIGGAVGGTAFQLITLLGLGGVWPALLGLTILGACIGLWIVVIERVLSAALMVLSGRHEGREIFLDKAEMRIGRNDGLEVFLGGDPGIVSHHATIRVEGGAHVVVAADGKVLVRNSSVSRHPLNDGDVLQLGKTRLVYKRKAWSKDPATEEEKSQPTRQNQPKATPPPPPPPPRRKPKHT